MLTPKQQHITTIFFLFDIFHNLLSSEYNIFFSEKSNLFLLPIIAEKGRHINQISEPIHIRLRPQLTVSIPVIHLLRIHIIHQPDRQKLRIRHRQPQLHTPKQKQRRGHLPLCKAKFFLASASVCTFSPHSLISSVST